MPETAPAPTAIEVTWQLPHTPRSAPRARALLRSQLAEWKIGGEVTDMAELLLAELVANSLRHAGTPPGRDISLRFATYDGRLRVEVADANKHPPHTPAGHPRRRRRSRPRPRTGTG